ncbi:FxDxF family PEP-CTERM protein [Sphingobium sufflavum]|jgi:hypothetical protein|uniref:FxDxF family PEP-CTERM protein n=1 Tax=Sphingobium sufflavum TaxID=1129547 RepID=UPI001F3B1555|nr:FxDxF family PEP-CTERM protein [Sphingobium sufflavum]MCE7798520.1 FxDxF family PEP-CTERM protein [Sphingobium sufflavum]
MTFKSKLSGLALVAAAAVAPQVASAATVVNFSATPGAGGATVSFTNTFTFSVPSAGYVSLTLSSTDTGNLTNVNFNSTYVKLNGVTVPILSRGVNELRQILLLPVSAGTQTLLVRGSSQLNGVYNGTFSFSVPEAQTWAMLIVGFMGVGAVMRRRKAAPQNVQVSYA